MSYRPPEIALRDLGTVEATHTRELRDIYFTGYESDRSDTSVVFDTLEVAATASPDSPSKSDKGYKNQALYEEMNYVNALSDKRAQFLKKNCSIYGTAVFLMWLLAVIVYSHTNVQSATQLWRSEASTHVMGLQDRNITLNTYDPSRRNVSLDSYRKGQYRAQSVLVRWLEPAQFPKVLTEAARGFYLTAEKNSFVVRQVDSSYRNVILDSLQFEYQNTFECVENLILNPGDSIDNLDVWHLVHLDSSRQWRHSKFSLFWLWKPATGEYIPLRNPTHSLEGKESLEKLHFAEFDPAGKYILYGYEHDLYMMDLMSFDTTRITSTGSPSIFNGKPDWVYEEEVVASDRLIWWSSDLKFLIFASINDTNVSEYPLEYYTNPSDVIMSYDQDKTKEVSGISSYPRILKLKYPKTGCDIPIVSMFCFNVQSNETSKIQATADETIGEDFILYDAAWVDEDHFLMKLTDRTSAVQEKKVYVVSESTELVSSLNASTYGGWFEKASPLTLVKKKNHSSQYLDRIVKDDIVHLALFEDAMSLNYSRLLGPVTLSGYLSYDSVENVVYGVFGTDLNQTFGMVEADTGVFTPLATAGIYEARFSTDGQFVNLKYQGANEPWQKVLNMGLWAERGVDIESAKPLGDINRLTSILKETNLPTHIRSTVAIGSGENKVDLNIVEIFPPNFDKTRKYPLLVHAYGGPGSTKIDGTFDIDFQDVVSSEANAVILIIDPRGTGRDNWKTKSFAKGKIGYWEPRDITAVTKSYIQTTKFIDEEKVAVGGWSYGGFTTLKTLEYDKGETFKYGIAVAPVTNWLFYDAIYTERYMGLPDINENYQYARISEIQNFGSVTRFLIVHGTADDNVHLQNSLWFIDQLNLGDIDNFDVHFFPDSEHSIYHNNANKLVFEKLLWWLQRAFLGYYE